MGTAVTTTAGGASVTNTAVADEVEVDPEVEAQKTRDAVQAALNPCEVCGEWGPCGYDQEGRPLIHYVEPDDVSEEP